MRSLILLLLLALPTDSAWWTVQTSGIDTNLRGVSIFVSYDAKGAPFPIVWASGSNGVVLRSPDDGKTWKRLVIPGTEKLDFRGIKTVNANIAYLMSAGEGEKSRIYKTTDAGATWTLQYTGNRPAIFLDGISCVTETKCFAISDPVDGKFLILSTTDGAHWTELPRDQMPAALPNEGIFAASNSAFLAAVNENTKSVELLFGTGGPAARVFRSTDSGHTWTVSETPIAHSNASSGIFSVCDAKGTLIVVGGDYKATKASAAVAAYSTDYGLTWKLSETQPGGFRSALTAYGDIGIAAVGPSGTDFSADFGMHWQPTEPLDLNAMELSIALKSGWAVGSKGTVARFQNHAPIVVVDMHP